VKYAKAHRKKISRRREREWILPLADNVAMMRARPPPNIKRRAGQCGFDYLRKIDYNSDERRKSL
jgi:hypothetical protein